MLNKNANRLVNLLEKYYLLPDGERPIYVYGFELLISTLSSMLSIIGISLIINKPIYALFFFLFFFTLRLFCGGYHASTYLKCFITTNAVFISIVILTRLILLLQVQRIIPVAVIFSTASVWIFSPVKNIHHPCSEKTYEKNKNISRILSSLYLALFIYLCFFTNQYDVIVQSGLSFTMVSVMIIIEKIRLFKEVNDNELYQH